MKIVKKYYPFWLGLLVFIILNGFEIIRSAPSIGMLIMYLIGYFKLTKLHNLEDGTTHFAHSSHWDKIVTQDEWRELQLNKIIYEIK